MRRRSHRQLVRIPSAGGHSPWVPPSLGLLLCLGILPGWTAAAEVEPVRILLLAHSPDGHPAGTHEYLPGQRLLAQLLRRVPEVEPEVKLVRGDWMPGRDEFQGVNGLVLFVSEGARWLHEAPRRYQAIAEFAERGGGLAALHWGTGTRQAEHIAPYLRLLGACHGGPDRKYQVLTTRLRMAAEDHPILRGVESFEVRDEFYYRLKRVGAGQGLVALAAAHIEDGDEMVAWAWQRPGRGRSFGFTGLHFHDNWRHEAYRRLVSQGVLWTVDRSPAQPLDVSLPPSAWELPPANTPKP